MDAIQTTLGNYPAEAVGAGSVLLSRAVRPSTVIFIESGRVAIGVIDERCEDLVHQIAFLQGPCWLEVASSLLNLPSTVSAIAKTEVLLRRVPLSHFHANFTASVENIRAMLFDLAKAHRQQTSLSVSRLSKGAVARCAEWLLAQDYSVVMGARTVELKLSKRDISAEIGITPETLSRALTSMRASRHVSGAGRIVKLLNLRGLRSLARG